MNDAGKNRKRLFNVPLKVVMLLQCAAMVAKKLPVEDKITASVRQICHLVVVCEVSKRKHCLVKHFALLKKVHFAINV